MPDRSLISRSLLLLLIDLKQTEYGVGQIPEEGSASSAISSTDEFQEGMMQEGSTSSTSNGFDFDEETSNTGSIELHKEMVFYKPTFLEGRRISQGIFQTTSVTSLIECLFLCTNDGRCVSINYKENALHEDKTKNCELIRPTQTEINLVVKDDRFTIYIIFPTDIEEADFCTSSPCPYSSECDAKSERCVCTKGYTGQFCEIEPPSTCYDVKMNNWESASGSYWIKPLQDKDPIQVICDMETDGGMWTLVYQYTLTNYENFNSLNNAVFPRPDWPANEADVQISTNSPVNGIGAVNFSLWKHIGSVFLIKSNINDWIVCTPETGSLVRPTNGTISCRNINDVTTSECTPFAPTKITWSPCGPKLAFKNTMYFFDGSTSDCWPTHNPCENSWMNNYETGISEPGGYIFLRF